MRILREKLRVCAPMPHQGECRRELLTTQASGNEPGDPVDPGSVDAAACDDDPPLADACKCMVGVSGRSLPATARTGAKQSVLDPMNQQSSPAAATPYLMKPAEKLIRLKNTTARV